MRKSVTSLFKSSALALSWLFSCSVFSALNASDKQCWHITHTAILFQFLIQLLFDWQERDREIKIKASNMKLANNDRPWLAADQHYITIVSLSLAPSLRLDFSNANCQRATQREREGVSEASFPFYCVYIFLIPVVITIIIFFPHLENPL